MARNGVVAYSEGGTTRLDFRPLELVLTMPIVKTETGAGRAATKS